MFTNNLQKFTELTGSIKCHIKYIIKHGFKLFKNWLMLRTYCKFLAFFFSSISTHKLLSADRKIKMLLIYSRPTECIFKPKYTFYILACHVSNLSQICVKVEIFVHLYLAWSIADIGIHDTLKLMHFVFIFIAGTFRKCWMTVNSFILYILKRNISCYVSNCL